MDEERRYGSHDFRREGLKKGILLGSTILTQFRFRPDSVYNVFLLFPQDSVFLDLYVFVYVSFGLRYFPVTFLVTLVICFMSPFTSSLCFPCAHYVSLFHFLGLRSFP